MGSPRDLKRKRRHKDMESNTAVASTDTSSSKKRSSFRRKKKFDTLKSTSSAYKASGQRFVLSDKGLQRIERFILTPDENGCALWAGPSVDSQGRPHIILTDKSKQPTRVMRLLWEHYYGELPSTTWVVRMCKNKLCCSLSHYKAVEMSHRKSEKEKPADPTPKDSVGFVVIEDAEGNQFVTMSDDIPEGYTIVPPSAPQNIDDVEKKEAAEFWDAYTETQLAPTILGKNDDLELTEEGRFVVAVYPILHELSSRARTYAESTKTSVPVAITKSIIDAKFSVRIMLILRTASLNLLQVLQSNQHANSVMDTAKVMYGALNVSCTSLSKLWPDYYSVPEGTAIPESVESNMLSWAESTHVFSRTPSTLPADGELILEQVSNYFD